MTYQSHYIPIATVRLDPAQAKLFFDSILQKGYFAYIFIYPSGSIDLWEKADQNPDIYNAYTRLVMFDCERYIAYTHNVLRPPSMKESLFLREYETHFPSNNPHLRTLNSAFGLTPKPVSGPIYLRRIRNKKE